MNLMDKTARELGLEFNKWTGWNIPFRLRPNNWAEAGIAPPAVGTCIPEWDDRWDRWFWRWRDAETQALSADRWPLTGLERVPEAPAQDEKKKGRWEDLPTDQWGNPLAWVED